MIIRFVICLAFVAGLYLLIAGAFYYVAGLREEISILSSNNTKLENSVQRQARHIERTEMRYRSATLSRDKLANELAESERRRQTITQEYNSYRGRLENAAIKRPEIVGRSATDATNAVLRDIAKETEHNNNHTQTHPTQTAQNTRVV